MMIETQPDMCVVAEASSAEEAVDVVVRHAPDILVMDLAMPGGGSIDAIREIQESTAHTRVLVLSMHDETSYLRAVIAAGGSGYVTKRSADAELLTAIRTVFAGRTYVDVSLSDRPPPLVDKPPPRADVPAPSILSEREREVLRLVALGFTNKEIAQQIHVSVKSVESYRARVADKLDLRSRAELVRYALEVGLIG